MPIVNIQGINCLYRPIRDGEEILYAGLPEEDQYFKQTPMPFTDEDLIAIASREHSYTQLQQNWVDRQNYLFDQGLYAYIKGELTFIPGAYWCYLNFWTLEHGDKPEYREDDREFFLFHEYLRTQTNCLGISRLKGRRQGATSIAMFFMWFIAGRNEHKLCGLTSFSDSAASDAFQRMFMYGFKAMLPCFQADFDSDSDNFIRFVKPVDKKKKGVLAVKREGLNSYCDYKSNVINSYDSGRQSYNVPDEAGKRNKVNINSYWSRLYKTLLVGINKVGFAYLPTTVGSKKEGGENYKLFWGNANQYAIDEKTGETVGINTTNRCVQYFVPATRCYSGCIDKYGRSVIDDPEEPIMSNDGRWITEGARTIILREREKLTDEQLMEHRRDYPLDVWDAFAFETGSCEFNEENFISQIRVLEQNPKLYVWRQVRLYEQMNLDKKRNEIAWADDTKGCWWLYEEPKEPNKFIIHSGYLEPANTLMYSAGADTYKNIFALQGSNGAIIIMKKSCLINGVETGLYPVAIYLGRPKLIKDFNKQALFGCLFFGCKINFEIDAGTWFYEDFLEWKCLDFLEWSPAVDLTKGTKQIKPGTESANPFVLAKQLEVAKIYYDGTRTEKELYNGHVHRVTYIPLLNDSMAYNHAERTPSHLTVALMMALLPMLARNEPPKSHNQQIKRVLPTYKLKLHQN